MNKTKILDFLKSTSAPMTKREIGKALNVQGGPARIELKKTLKALETDGVLIKQPGGKYAIPDRLPNVTIVEVIDIDIDGDLFATPVDWSPEVQGPPPRIEIMPGDKGHASLALKDLALVRLSRADKDVYEARVIKKLDTERGRVLGLLKMTKRGAILAPTDKKAKNEFIVPQAELNGARDGDLCIAEIQPSRGLKLKNVRIIDVLGKRNDPKAISLISLHEAGIIEEFPAEVLKAAEGLKVPPVKGREDLRNIPLVTIDGADARDFDDAVFAEKTDKGFHLIVAIADVAYYVKPESALDNEAQRRGNSTYFPDRVVPMLPEALSNDLCSLRPHENRACLAVHLYIDHEGQLVKHKFVRGLMKSHARLTYEQVQAARDGQTDEITQHLMGHVIEPLYEAFDILDTARQKRGALELELPERQIILNDKNNMTGVRKRDRLDAHKLIEEFMILANVAAATALETKAAQNYPCVYRVHDKPSFEKLTALREFISSFELNLPKGNTISPKNLNNVLHHAKKMEYSHLISQVVLRSQSQAIYSTDNLGHFGLALSRYAHFTSPIRRYADLLVHRALIASFGLGPGGMAQGEIARIDEICDHICKTERSSMEAERNAVDRFTAAFLSTQIGAEFDGQITGVTRFGLFVSLNESGADGLIPMRSMKQDFFVHDEKEHALIGRRTGIVFRLGARVRVRLKEADGLTGSTVLELVGHDKGADIPGFISKNNHSPNHRKDKGASRGKKPKKHHKRKKNKRSS